MRPDDERTARLGEPFSARRITRRAAIPAILALPVVALGGYAALNPETAKKEAASLGKKAEQILFTAPTLKAPNKNGTPTVIGTATTPTGHDALGYAPGEADGHVSAEIFKLTVPETQKPLLTKVTNLALGSEARTNAEKELAARSKSSSEIRAAFLVTDDVDVRIELRNNYFALMNKEHPGSKLTPNVKQWGNAHLTDKTGTPYHDIGLTLLRKNYRATRKIVELLLPGYKNAGIVASDATPAKVTPTPGLAGLILGNESSMFAGIGKVPAIDHVSLPPTLKDKIDNEKALRDTIKLFVTQTGVSYPVANFPGNEASALGQDQVMPYRAAEIANDLQKIGIIYNPFDIEQAYLPIAILLIRGGYRAGNAKANEIAVKAWSGDEKYREKMLAADTSYRASFPEELI